MDEQQFHDHFYDEEAEPIFSSPLYRALLDLHVRFLVEVTRNLRDGRILSIGCGDGRRELAMANHAGGIVGLDISPVAIEKARELARQLGIRNVEFQVDDASDLERRYPKQFDAVWCPGVLHHLSDREIVRLLRSSRAALKSGGSFVSMDPSSQRAVNLLKPFVRRAYRKYHSPEEKELRPAHVVTMLREAGFREIEVRFTDWFISPLAWLLPRLSAGVARPLVRLDQFLVKIPVLKEMSSGFAVVARHAD
jgi:SAM-dependent methyltransferase